MAVNENVRAVDISRRRLLRGAALAAAGSGALLGVGLTASKVAAQTKVSQTLANYQRTPKGAAQCDSCTQWQAPSSCKVVEGAISPAGWCTLYALSPKS
jgi:hypothetical protein